MTESVISSIVLNGDISRLTQDEKVSYYRQFCHRLGLDPISQPFKLLRLNGKKLLYCDRSGAQQLNKLHKVSHEIRARETVSGCYIVTAKASTPDGRQTESIGAVHVESLKGDSLCNAMMKAETKAKRRATLDLLGLGILDELEADSLNGAIPIPVPGESSMSGISSPVEHPAQFKRSYQSVQDIRQVLGNARSIVDLSNLYYINAQLVEANPELKKEFSTKKLACIDPKGLQLITRNQSNAS